MQSRLLQAMSRLPLRHVFSGIPSSASSSAFRSRAFCPLSRCRVGEAVVSQSSSKINLPLLGFCFISFLFTGCLESLDEAIGKNQPPVANAGDDQTVDLAGEEATVTLDGSKSEDKDGKIVSYIWKGGNPTSISIDAGVGDGGAANGTGIETDATDANTVDANTADTNTVDANTADANTVDANTVDANTADAGLSDNDAGMPIPEAVGILEGGIEEVLETPDPEDTVKPQISLGEGVHTFHLWVTDDDGATSMDTVVITVKKPD